MSTDPISNSSVVDQIPQSRYASLLNNKVTKIFLGSIACLLSYLYLPLPLAFLVTTISFMFVSKNDKESALFGSIATLFSFLYLSIPVAFGATVISFYLASKNDEHPNYNLYYSDNERDSDYYYSDFSSYSDLLSDSERFALGPVNHLSVNNHHAPVGIRG